jgi:hypothetical protein
MKRKKQTPKAKRILKLNDTFDFKGASYKISHLSEVGVRAEVIGNIPLKRELRTLYWFGTEHFERETGFKINTEGGFPVSIEPYRYVVSPNGLGEVVKVKNDEVNVRLFNPEGRRGRRKTMKFTHDQLKSLSQHHPQLSNAGSYIKGVERINIPYSKEMGTQGTIEVVKDIQDGKWRYGIEFQLPSTRGGIYGPSKLHSKTFDERNKAIRAAVYSLKAIMREETRRNDTSQEQRQKINEAINITHAWFREQFLNFS